MTNNYQISSNLTLFYKMFLPTAWISFFGMFAIALFFFPLEVSLLNRMEFKIGYMVFFLFFLSVLYFSVMQLKRVEFNPTEWTVTNYLKTYRYNYSDIEKITITNLGLINLSRIHLKDKGSFGKKLPIILNKPVFKQFLDHYPELIEGSISGYQD